MDSDLEEDLLLLSIIALYKKRTIKKRKNRRFAINPFLRLRSTKGRFAKDFEDLVNHPPSFKENFHMTQNDFHNLLQLVGPHLSPKPRSRADSFTASEKLAMTIEYLASGSYQRHVASIYRASKQGIGKVITDTCEILYRTLQPDYLKAPSASDWTEISNRFNSMWNFPNCLGAIDGKHVGITNPINSGSAFHNYKGFFSIVLMAVGDADYRFIYIDVGAYGSEGDSTIFRNSSFGKALSANKLKLPPHATVSQHPLPFYFVGDDAFPLHERIMKPYVPAKGMKLSNEERIFNYRLSRARRCIENSFGILGSRWRVLARTMQISPDRAQKVVAACCVLHNYLMTTSKSNYCPDGYGDTLDDEGNLIEGCWRTNIPSSSCLESTFTCGRIGRLTDNAKSIRDQIKDYVNSEIGRVPWQDDRVFG